MLARILQAHITGAFQKHRFYDALQCPVIFPRGEDGYYFNLGLDNPRAGGRAGKKVSETNGWRYLTESYIRL